MSRLRITFVRHGETNENRNKIIQGQMDSQLNALGRRQAAAVAQALKDIPFTHAFSSDLSRARETAESILKFHDTPLITQRALREKFFGAAEGLPYGAKVTDRGESFYQFRKRIIGWWIQTMSGLLAGNSPEQGTLEILVVSHGAFLRCLLQALTTDPDFHFSSFANGGKLGMMPNSGVATLDVVGVYQGRLTSYGDDSHLKTLDTDGVEIESLAENADDLAI